MDWLSFACGEGEQWKINDMLNICQDHSEHNTDRQRQSLTRHLHWIGLLTTQFICVRQYVTVCQRLEHGGFYDGIGDR